MKKITIPIQFGYPAVKVCINDIEYICLTGKEIEVEDCVAELVDIAPEAVKATEHNAKLNNVADRITARVGSLTEGASGSYDLIVANILADPVIELLGDLSRLCKKKTTVVLSGIKDIREDDVLEAAKDFKVMERHSRDGWVCLVMKRK